MELNKQDIKLLPLAAYGLSRYVLERVFNLFPQVPDQAGIDAHIKSVAQSEPLLGEVYGD